jgi:hypothetical protein
MRVRNPILVSLSLGLAACGGGGPSAPPGLAYGLPAQTSVTYLTGDTTSVDIDAGGQSLQMSIGLAGSYAASFARAADGVQVTIAVEDFSARMNQPMGGPVTADEGGIDGPLVFTLDRKGNVALVSRPELSGNARQFFGSLSIANSFFPGLPGGAVAEGDSWVDTVSFEGTEGDGEVSSTSILTYTVGGSEMAGGRSVVRINVTGTSQVSTSGAVAGMDFSQDLSGEIEGYVLWDMQAGLMVESYAEGDASGSMDVSAAPFPLALRARQQSRTTLIDGM